MHNALAHHDLIADVERMRSAGAWRQAGAQAAAFLLDRVSRRRAALVFDLDLHAGSSACCTGDSGDQRDEEQ